MIDHNILYQYSTQLERENSLSLIKNEARKNMYVQICAIREGQSIAKKNTEKEKCVVYVDDSAFFLYMCTRSSIKQYRENKIS